MGIDERIDGAADKLRINKTIDRFFYALTEAANHSILWHLINATANRGDRRAALRMAAVLGIESALVNGGVKQLFNRERPDHVEPRPHRLRKPKTTSFPSGHATSAFCAATLLAENRPVPVQAAWFGLATLVSYSRVHVRLHHASDVLGGIVIGLILGRAARRLWPLAK